MAQLNLILDGVIILLSLWVLKFLVGYGGQIGKALSVIGVGTVIFGLAQLAETAMSIWLHFDVSTLESIHRVILIIGFILIVWGYKLFMRRPA